MWYTSMSMQKLLRQRREKSVIQTGEKLRRLEVLRAQTDTDALDGQIKKLRRKKQRLLEKLQEGDSNVRA